MSSDMTRQRAEIEGAIVGRTLCDKLRQAAETSGDAWAYFDEAGAGGGWRSLTWSQVRQRVLELAAGFAALGMTAETEELTPTLKLKRRVVHAKYADVIDSLYPR